MNRQTPHPDAGAGLEGCGYSHAGPHTDASSSESPGGSGTHVAFHGSNPQTAPEQPLVPHPQFGGTTVEVLRA
jgi:hypothetical protein